MKSTSYCELPGMRENPAPSIRDGDVLDETYTRMRATGPEFQGWLSNHGPMAADALIRLGCGDMVEGWVDGYSTRLDEAPGPRWPIAQDEWREALGDPSRLGDWCALFERQLADEPWQDILVRWWPRLLDGAVASAAHGLIRTGHAVRAVLERPTAPRVAELAQALGYWVARHQRLPAHPRPHGDADPAAALDAVPTITTSGGIRTRLNDLAHTPGWPGTVGRLRSTPSPGQVPAALDDLVDAAVTRYQRWGHSNPIMLVHAATAPRAAGLALPALPKQLWVPTYEAAWAVTAAISTIYRPSTPPPPATSSERQPVTPEQVTARAIATGDEHARSSSRSPRSPTAAATATLCPPAPAPATSSPPPTDTITGTLRQLARPARLSLIAVTPDRLTGRWRRGRGGFPVDLGRCALASTRPDPAGLGDVTAHMLHRCP